MTRPRLSILLAFAAILAGQEAVQAQGFFERLFGLTPARPLPPPVYPGAPAPDAPPAEEPKRAAPPPVQARPVALRVPTEDGILGRDLKLNGAGGSLRIDRTARSDLRARLTIGGRRSAQSVETCSVTLGGPDGATLVSMGKPDGLPRYQLQDAACPMQIDVLDESVLIKGPGEVCLFQAANCQADPSGLWGPDPGQLLPKVRDYETARATADKAVRENYKVLVQRARPEQVRPIVAEQAAFSSDREMICRSYAREASHSFCNARFSEARAISLAQRLGVTVTASNQPAEARPRRRPANDPYGLPATDEIVQRPAED